MIALIEPRAHWLQAFAISLALHGVAAAAMLDVIPDRPRARTVDPDLRIEVRPLAVETGAMAPPILSPVQPQTLTGLSPLTARVPQPASQPPIPKAATSPLAPADDLQGATVPLQPADAGPALAPVDVAALAPHEPAGEAAATADLLQPDPTADAPTPDALTADALTADGPAANPAQDRALADLISTIRDRLAEPCLIALPSPSQGDALQLTALGTDQDSIDRLFDELGTQPDVPLEQSGLLLDARQCPALNFARAAPTYPVYPLRITLERADIASGASLRGSVAAPDDDGTLAVLLIDDNGVVQDLGRFAIARGQGMSFDVPMRRAGEARGTAQVLMAVATPRPLAAVAAEAGRDAETFFAALTAEGVDAASLRIGLVPFTLR